MGEVSIWSLRPNVDESPVSAFRLRPNFGLKSGLRPNRRREVKFGLKFGLRPKFSLRLQSKPLVLAEVDLTQ